MSRYRDDNDYRDGRGRDYDERERRERGGYYGTRGAEPFDSAYDEGARREMRPPREYEGERDLRDERGDERDFRERNYYRNDYSTGAVGRRGERYDYERGERRYDDDRRDYGRGYEDEREGRSLWEEGREYFTRRGGARRGRTSRSHVRCRDIMTRDVTVATRETSLEEVARMMRDEDTGVIPVVERMQNAPLHTAASASANAAKDAGTAVTPVVPVSPAPIGESPEARRINADIHGNGRLVGLITDRDIVVRALAEGREARTTRAEEIMTAEVHTAHPNDRVIDAIRKMGDKQVRRIPVVDRDGTLRGIISMADVALETNDDRELAEALEEISSGSSFWNRVFG
jgi:CBS domain-containing protein